MRRYARAKDTDITNPRFVLFFLFLRSSALGEIGNESHVWDEMREGVGGSYLHLGVSERNRRGK